MTRSGDVLLPLAEDDSHRDAQSAHDLMAEVIASSGNCAPLVSRSPNDCCARSLLACGPRQTAIVAPVVCSRRNRTSERECPTYWTWVSILT